MPNGKKSIREYANIAIEKYSDYINTELELIAEGDNFKKQTVIKTQKAREEWDYAATTFYGIALQIKPAKKGKETNKKPAKKLTRK